ncbi:hypothetical protein [Erwinia mallotivora]|nr:hypothetical protein [Erwinia mallotivora]
MPCLRSKEVWAEKNKEDNKKAYDFIRENLLEKVKNNDADGIFRSAPNHAIMQEIKSKPLGYNALKRSISRKNVNEDHVLSQILLLDVRRVEKKITLPEMLRLLKPGVEHDSKSIRDFVMKRISFKSEQEKENFSKSMSIIAEIYTEVGKRPCIGCTLYTLAQAIAPSIFDDMIHSPDETVTGLENMNNYGKTLPESAHVILQNWNKKLTDVKAGLSE